jgi:SAM-dependent methyltransferase
MRLLDVGCGTGTITIGLARVVAPGAVVGIDRNAASIERGAGQHIDNVSFQVADAVTLPFDDASFDVVFAHALLQHVEEPRRVVSECRRVLRSNGVIAVADADLDGGLFAPANDLLDRALKIQRHTRRNPQIGRQLRGLLTEAGFERVRVSASAGARGDTNSVTLEGEFQARYFEAEPFIAYAEAQGWSTRAEMLAIAEAWRAWSVDPRAFSATFLCQALGFTPRA